MGRKKTPSKPPKVEKVVQNESDNSDDLGDFVQLNSKKNEPMDTSSDENENEVLQLDLADSDSDDDEVSSDMM